MKKLKFLLDNNVIDILGDTFNDLLLSYSYTIELFICSTVLEELASIPDTKRNIRIKNLILLARLETKFLNDSIVIWDSSRWDCSIWNDGIVYNEILNDSCNNTHDAIIAETAVKNGCYLITDDIRLYKKMKQHNYRVLNSNEWKQFLLNTLIN